MGFLSHLKVLEPDKSPLRSTVQHEPTHHSTYDAEALAAKAMKDVYALMPWVDRDDPAREEAKKEEAKKEEAKKEEAKKEEAKKAEDKKLRESMDDAKAVVMATQLAAYSQSMDGATGRKFIQVLDSIDNPYLRAQVMGQFAAQTGHSLQHFIENCNDWNNTGDKRDKNAALSLIDDKRSKTQDEIAKLSPAQRDAMMEEARKRANAIKAAQALHDTSDENEHKILKELGGCNAMEIELLRTAMRETTNQEDNLYQVLDDGMSGKNEDTAVAMLDGNRALSAQVELAAVKDTARMRERFEKMSPVELAELRNSPATHMVIASLDNPADREELQAALAGNKVKANAVKLGNALKPKFEGYVGPKDKASNDNCERRSPAEVLKLFESMPPEEVKAAVAEWNKANPLRPMESMLEARWGDDSDPTEYRRLKSALKGDVATNAALRARQGMDENKSELIEAAMTETDPAKRAAFHAAMQEEDRLARVAIHIATGGTLESAAKIKGRSTNEQITAHYDKVAADEAKGLEQLRGMNSDGVDAAQQKSKEEIDDKRHAALELSKTGKVSIATEMHRAKDDKARVDSLSTLKTREELAKAEALYRERYGKDMLSSTKSRRDMSANEMRIDNIRRHGPVETRPAELQYELDYELYQLQYSAELGNDEEKRAGGGTQRMQRQALMRQAALLKDPRFRIEHPEAWENPHDPAEMLRRIESSNTKRDVSVDDIEDSVRPAATYWEDGLKDGATRKDFDRARETKAIADQTQTEAKKRLADRITQRLSMVAKIAGAITANPWLIAALTAAEGLGGMAIKKGVMGEAYEWNAADFTKVGIDVGADLLTGGIAKYGKTAGAAALLKGTSTAAQAAKTTARFALAGGAAKLVIKEVGHGLHEGKSPLEVLRGVAAGSAGLVLPGAVRSRITEAISSGNAALAQKIIGEVMGAVGEGGASALIAIAGGADPTDAFIEAGISTAGSLGQKAVEKKHPAPSPHVHPSDADHLHPSHGVEKRSAPMEVESHHHPSHVDSHVHPADAHPTLPHGHPSAKTHVVPDTHGATSSPAHTRPVAAEAHVLANGHHAEEHQTTRAGEPQTGRQGPLHEPERTHSPGPNPAARPPVPPHATGHADAHVVANGHHAESEHTKNAHDDHPRTGASNSGVVGAGSHPTDHRTAQHSGEVTARANGRRAQLDEHGRRVVDEQLAIAKEHGHDVVLERALAAGRSPEEIKTLRLAMTSMTQAEAIHFFSGAGLIQYYHQSCVPTAYQIALAEVDPVYALHLRNNPGEMMRSQRDVLVDGGAAQTPRGGQSNKGPNAKAHLEDPETRAALGEQHRYSKAGEIEGIDVRSMSNQKLHKDLEKATGSPYEIMAKRAGTKKLDNIPVDRIVEAARANKPVMYSHLGHEYTIVGVHQGPDGPLLKVHDPASGTVSLLPPSTLGILNVESVTLPGAAHDHQGSAHAGSKDEKPPETAAEKRARLQALRAAKHGDPQQKAAEAELDKHVEKNIKRMERGELKLSAEDAAFVDRNTEEGRRNFRRASDPDKGLSASTIDEVRAMDAVEKSGQFGAGAQVERSVQPGADVVVKMKDNAAAHYSMKAIRPDLRPADLDHSRGIVTGLIQSTRSELEKGVPMPGIMVDLRSYGSRSEMTAERARVQQQVDAANEDLRRNGRNTIAVHFIENPGAK